jgi:putative ABC transport system permease protein
VKWSRNLRLSVRALTRSWLRTTLSVSAVAIGITSVVVLLGAGAGAERALLTVLEQLGRNLLVVSANRTETGALRGGSRVTTTLTIADWSAMATDVPGVLRTAPVAEGNWPVRVGGRRVPARVTGTTPGFRQARNVTLAAGRFIDEDDLRDSRRVAVVGAIVVEGLFQGESPLGEWLFVRGAPFRIIGVTKKKGVVSGANDDELVIIPLTTAMDRLLNVEHLDRVYVQSVSEEVNPRVRADLAALMRERHVALAGSPADFRIQDQTAMIRAQQQAGRALSRFAPGLAALVLGLGGVGLLAISLLSVRERYAEIGLRLAVGGRPSQVFVQFLTEAALISVLGGMTGVVAGATGIRLGSALTRWPMVLSWQAVVYPLAVSVAIAMIFGAYPALRAARLDPIEALNSK